MFSSHEGGMFLNSHSTDDEIKFQTLGIEVSLKGHPSHCTSHSLRMGIVNNSLTLQRTLLNTHCLYTYEDISSCLFLQSELSPFWSDCLKTNRTTLLIPDCNLFPDPFWPETLFVSTVVKEGNSSLYSHVTQRHLGGQVIPTEWQTQHLWDGETGACSDVC